ncbi:MAG: cob(I)yrinic acid a,c-diamide adenosyltransferase [Desulfobacteraceae bacterium]|nr:MAG: cob(I)yrinic acid a,c-diamide adenosyltransferase [Desulfobacteraceae bacterium]
MKGYVQVYTGNGKGKTTASIGLAVRAAGAGLKVFIGQFLKQGDYSEIKSLKKYENITVEQYGKGRFVKGKPSTDELQSGKEGYHRILDILRSGNHDLVIAEEANVAVMCNIISEDELMELLVTRPDHVELVITGRGAPACLLEKADLVTEMKEVKHYYAKGVAARVGIEK